MTRLHTWMVGLSSAAFVGLLVLIVILGNAAIGLTAMLLILGATASQALGSTLSNGLAGAQLHAERHVRPGAHLVLSGPSGAITGTVRSVGARLTVLETSDSQTALVPNSALTSGLVLIVPPPTQPKEHSCTATHT